MKNKEENARNKEEHMNLNLNLNLHLRRMSTSIKNESTHKTLNQVWIQQDQ